MARPARAWRVETEPDLLLVAYRLGAESYEPVGIVDDVGPAPAPWGPVLIDLASIRRTSS